MVSSLFFSFLFFFFLFAVCGWGEERGFVCGCMDGLKCGLVFQDSDFGKPVCREKG